MGEVPRHLLRYAVAMGLVAAALLVGLLLRPYLTATPDAAFFAAVALASWFRGLVPGLIATVGSALAVDYFLIPPLHEISFDADHLVRLATFTVVSLLISWISHSLQRERKRAEQREADARRELAERQRIETERVALLAREREARRQAEAAQRRLAFLAEAGRLVASSLEFETTLTTAASTREALEIVAAERPHVLIGDIGMPGEDGYALIRLLRARPGQQGGRIPAIGLTAYARCEDCDRALDAGFQIHLSKPIDHAELAEAVASLVGRDPQIHAD